ncbi:hypothetical protein BJV82DRAFT_675939 [Fennellomyces sp. T-0311]|nr:hypothetical protein BJV82DRAFT_675939 [Fennellomyces sp. T-0311]
MDQQHRETFERGSQDGSEQQSPWSFSQQLPAGYQYPQPVQQSQASQQSIGEQQFQQQIGEQQFQQALPQQLNVLSTEQIQFMQTELAYRREMEAMQRQLLELQEQALTCQREWQQARDAALAAQAQQHQGEIQQLTRNMHNMYEELRTTASPTMGQQPHPLLSPIRSLLTTLEQQEIRRDVSQREMMNRIEEWRASATGGTQIAVSQMEETLTTRDEPLITALQNLTAVMQQRTESQLPTSIRTTRVTQTRPAAQTTLLSSIHSESSNEYDDHFETPSDHGASDGSSENSRRRVRVVQQNDTTMKTHKRRMDIPVFRGHLNEDPYAWLLVFEKAGEYYGWSDDDKKKEFMISMQGQAVYWWDSLSDIEKADYASIKTAFTTYFGGGDEAAVLTLTDLPKLKQNTESTGQK